MPYSWSRPPAVVDKVKPGGKILDSSAITDFRKISAIASANMAISAGGSGKNAQSNASEVRRANVLVSSLQTIPAALFTSAVYIPTLYITTIGGTGSAGFSGDTGLATGAQLNRPDGLAIDSVGNVYFADTGNSCVRKIDRFSNRITTFAGVGLTGGNGGVGGQANATQIAYPRGVCFDSYGDVYFTSNFGARKVATSTGVISAIAGTGSSGYSGDGGAATAATLSNTYGIAVDSVGNIYIADRDNDCIRKVTASTGFISTIAGLGTTSGFLGDGGSAASSRMYNPYHMCIDSANNIYISDSWNHCIRKITASTGYITTIAGVGTQDGFSGDGGLATAAKLNYPNGIAVDSSGNVFIADTGNNRIRKIDRLTKIITTLAGSGTAGAGGDGGAAISASLNAPIAVAVDSSGTIYVSDNTNHRIRKLYYQ
jgi:sugar lactone lactonase YvrE